MEWAIYVLLNTKLEKEGFEVILSSNPSEILSADKLILPGVGNSKSNAESKSIRFSICFKHSSY